MKVVTFSDIQQLNISPTACYTWASKTIANKGMQILPPKISMSLSKGSFCNVMPSIISDNRFGHIGGVKIVTRYPEQTPSLDSKLLLFHGETGEYIALMDANWITAMRTGAVAVHSILLLAKPNFSRVSIIGLGNTARAALLILAEMLPDRKLTIRLMAYKAQEFDFINRFCAYSNLHFEIVDSYEKLVHGADVLISAVTYCSDDLCQDDYFDEGILVVPIHTRGFSNCDLFFDKVYGDDTGHVCHFKYFDRFRYFAEVSDIVNGQAPGRENSQERIIVYNVGISLHDVQFAVNIYKLIEDRHVPLSELDLGSPNKKFWL